MFVVAGIVPEAGPIVLKAGSFAIDPRKEMIVSGLEDTYPCMRKSEILDYLGRTEGNSRCDPRRVARHMDNGTLKL